MVSKLKSKIFLTGLVCVFLNYSHLAYANNSETELLLLQYQQLLDSQQQAKEVVKEAPEAHQETIQTAATPSNDIIFEAASDGDVRLIGQLLNEGVNVNTANHNSETALHMAAARGHYSAVIYLVNNGANIYARTINNWQPIHHATRFRHVDIANFLTQKGSQIHAKTSDNKSAIDMARAVNDRRLLGVFGVR